MASNNNSRKSSCSVADSGISCSTINSNTINLRYACYWVDSCKGYHEWDNCPIRPHELRSKLGIYYSSNGIFKRFTSCQIGHNLSLKDNSTGCTMVNLLIYEKKNNENWLLFVTKSLKEKRQKHDGGLVRQPLLTLPSSNPCKKGEHAKDVATRALQTITDRNEINEGLRSRLQRFLFVDASVIYPLYLTNDQAKLLTDNFESNEEVTALHWFPLSVVLERLPEWNQYPSKPAEEKELAQVHHPHCDGIKLQQGNEEHTMWSVTIFQLMCIKSEVGFETFLRT